MNIDNYTILSSLIKSLNEYANFNQEPDKLYDSILQVVITIAEEENLLDTSKPFANQLEELLSTF
ncbi:hypothetical protein L4D00_15085 [Photobacterium swingsii]|uniref:hypothetical protein n=1 Tax=Photobacterium swingsii TaxID=680026 RepID=UPI003D10F9C1